MAAGRYIAEADIDNFSISLTEAQKQAIIDRIEERVEKITGDFFYPKLFDIYLDGNGKDRLFLDLTPSVLSITSVKFGGTTINSDYWAYNEGFIFLDPEGITGGGEVELRWLLSQTAGAGLFPRGISNVRIAETYGWPERLDIDNVSGTFEARETITGGASAATAIVVQVEPLYLIIRARSGTLVNNEEITGGTSAATADVNNASGAVNDPPENIKQACIILCRRDNNDTLYTAFILGSENFGFYRYSQEGPRLTGIREADDLLFPFVRHKVRMAIV